MIYKVSTGGATVRVEGMEGLLHTEIFALALPELEKNTTALGSITMIKAGRGEQFYVSTQAVLEDLGKWRD